MTMNLQNIQCHRHYTMEAVAQCIEKVINYLQRFENCFSNTKNALDKFCFVNEVKEEN